MLQGASKFLVDEVVADPSVLLDPALYKRLLRDSPILVEYATYNERIHTAGGGTTASGSPTDESYWQAARDGLLKYAATFVKTDSFKRKTEVWCSEFRKGLLANDFGWMGRLELISNSELGMLDPTPSYLKAKLAAEHFRLVSPWILAYSPNEPFFGQFDGKLTANPQLRLDSAGALATAQHNGTFGPGSELRNMPAAAKVVVRSVVRSGKKEAAKQIKVKAGAAADAKEERKRRGVESALVKSRAEHAQALVAHDIFVPTSAEVKGAVGAMQNGTGAKKAAQQLCEEVYEAVVIGWKYDKYACVATTTNKKKKCVAGIGCGNVLLHTGWGAKLGKVRSGTALAHKFRHSLNLREKIDDGTITPPPRPVPPPPPRRGFGNVQLGTLVADAADRDMRRAEVDRQFMEDVVDHPEKYSKSVHTPAVVAANLVSDLLLCAPRRCYYSLAAVVASGKNYRSTSSSTGGQTSICQHSHTGAHSLARPHLISAPIQTPTLTLPPTSTFCACTCRWGRRWRCWIG
jgi:hypothetical protein